MSTRIETFEGIYINKGTEGGKLGEGGPLLTILKAIKGNYLDAFLVGWRRGRSTRAEAFVTNQQK